MCPVLRESTFPCGGACLNVSHEITCEDRQVSRFPVRSPPGAPPGACCPHDSVCRSYITRSLKRSLPVVPKSSTRPSSRRSKVMVVLHSGQKVIVAGEPLREAVAH